MIPNRFPCLEVSGDDNPLKAKINNTPDIDIKLQINLLTLVIYPFLFYT